MSNEEFELLARQALDLIPQEFTAKLENVAVIIEDYPTPAQVHKLKLKPWTRLLGLYEGVSLRGRTSSFASPLPDKITIFKNSILSISKNQDEICENIRSVILHEIAHHFGFSEKQVRDAEMRRIKN